MPTAREIANSINALVRGPDLDVCGARSLKTAERGTIVFLNQRDHQIERKLNSIGHIVCITTPVLADELSCTCLFHDKPRLAFCLVLAKYFSVVEENVISTASAISAEASIGVDVSIGVGSVIGADVKIGAGTRIGNGVVIAGRVEIGTNCVIKSNITIGEHGFGFDFSPDGEPIPFPHIGGVMIGNFVEIGSNCNIARAVLDETVIHDHVKLNSLIHVAHNVIIGPRTLIAAGAIICGSAAIGSDVWIGPNATIIDKITVGDRAHVGIGSLVTRSVEPSVKVLGNPARKIPSSK